MTRPSWLVSVAAIFLSLVSYGAFAVTIKQPVVLHKKVRGSALLLHGAKSRKEQVELLQRPRDDGVEGTELLQQLAQARKVSDPELLASANEVFAGVDLAHKDSAKALHNSNEETEMLETQLLANGESLHIIKKLVETVQKMKTEVASLESHQQQCNQKLSELKNAEAQRTADTIAANTVQAAD